MRFSIYPTTRRRAGLFPKAVFSLRIKRMPRLIVILTIVLLFTNLPNRAQHMNEKDSPCAEVAVTADLSNCLLKAGEAADAKLNAAYKRLREKLDTADGQRLVTAQRLWVQYPDANCLAERDLYAGGTAAPPAYLACLEAMTRARTKELAVTYAVRLK
jgi:uncharacterized protein YecT (DUF1311 family)